MLPVTVASTNTLGAAVGGVTSPVAVPGYQCGPTCAGAAPACVVLMEVGFKLPVVTEPDTARFPLSDSENALIPLVTLMLDAEQLVGSHGRITSGIVVVVSPAPENWIW